MHHSPIPSLPLARYRYTFRMTRPLTLPAYAGSLLRGQFGASLRRVACMTGAPACTGCSLRQTCPYSLVFEAPAPASHNMQNFSHVPNPYVIEPPPYGTREVQAGDALQFCVVLVGDALRQLPLITFALQKALARGLGTEETRAFGDLEELAWQHGADWHNPVHFTPLWMPGDTAIAPHEAAVPPPPADLSNLRLQLHTPMRLQHQGRPLRPAELSPRKLLADLLRRLSLLAEFHAAQPALVEDARALVHHAESLTQAGDLRWLDWSRYSSRQQQEMTLGGVVGEWRLAGDCAPLLPWLWLGQWLHVGKNATMGMGQYRLLWD